MRKCFYYDKIGSKGVTMIVSAISNQDAKGYLFASSIPYFNARNNDPIVDKSFNSLAPYKKLDSSDSLSFDVYDRINEWKNFCQDQIICGKKLNVIA